MNQDDFKKLLDESLQPIKNDLDELKKNHGELKSTVEKRVLPSVTYIETSIKAYKDSYQINNANIAILFNRRNPNDHTELEQLVESFLS